MNYRPEIWKSDGDNDAHVKDYRAFQAIARHESSGSILNEIRAHNERVEAMSERNFDQNMTLGGRIMARRLSAPRRFANGFLHGVAGFR